MSADPAPTLAEFLLARITEEMPKRLPDEDIEPGDESPYYVSTYRHAGSCAMVNASWGDPDCDCNGAARTIAECEAKRQIVAAVETDARVAAKDIGRHMLRILAAAYCDHPDYNPAWQPRVALMASSARETWTADDGRPVVVDYDERGVAQISRDAMHLLLGRAAFTQTDSPAVSDRDRCVYCGAQAVRDHDSSIVTWVQRIGDSGAAGGHEHETIEGDS